MKNPLRVLAVFEATELTGPAKNLLQFAQLAREGVGDSLVNVEVAVFWRSGQPELFVEAANRAGIVLHRIPEQHRFDRSVIVALRNLVHQTRPDIVQTHAVKSHFLMRYSGLHREIPWLAFHHGYTATDWRVRMYNQLDWWSLRAAKRVIVVNDEFRADLMRRFIPRERIAVVHNAIDPHWAAAARQPEAALALRAKLGIPTDRKILLIAARLSKEKDHATLLRALAELHTRYRQTPCLIVLGDGRERPRIEADIRSLGLGEQVLLPGWVQSEPYYGIADVAVLSSVTEGSPNAVLEAIGASVPLVATAVGGIPEIVVDGESALLVPARDPGRMAEALHIILSSPELAARLTARGREIALTLHSPGARAGALCEVYRTIRPHE